MSTKLSPPPGSAETRPFDTIESAHEFIVLLEDSIKEAVADVKGHLLDANVGPDPRRGEVLTLALFKMNQLSSEMRKSRRILNDLRTLRRLLFKERGMNAHKVRGPKDPA